MESKRPCSVDMATASSVGEHIGKAEGYKRGISEMKRYEDNI